MAAAYAKWRAGLAAADSMDSQLASTIIFSVGTRALSDYAAAPAAALTRTYLKKLYRASTP